ncbi:MAG: type II toxin-antitoxin system RelE/ParE family toxin [Candidatus Micrarchaeota archaeon]|nr:type II toxin-antitoxin system RelE/ParE family toxin [Candidatus Micrarchaeota archaeon]
MYEIRFVKSAPDDLDTLESEMRQRVLAVLERIRANPFRYARKLTGSDFFRFRVGDYRIVAKIGENFITVHAIEHRKSVYK